MEAHANSVDDKLIEGLSFKLSPGASYVNERKSVTFHPSGSNIYSTNGTKLIKMMLTGDGWLDPSTFRIAFDLVNMASGSTPPAPQKILRPLGGPWTFFRRMRVLCGGTIVEDVDNYNRCHQMFSILTAADSRANIDAEGFGREWDIRQGMKVAYTATTFPGIKEGDSQTVLFKPLSGLFNQNKMIPLRYCPITIEMELVNDSTEPIISHLTDVGGFSAANTSLLWQIQNVQAKCDLCVLDNALDNSYAEHLLSGKSLPINYNTYVSQMQSLLSGTTGQQKVRLNVTRALSRLKSVFITFDKEVAGELGYLGRKSWNDFYSPMQPYAGNPDDQFDSNGEFEAQLQLGSKLYPEYPIRSHGEAFYQLRKTLGIQSSTLHNFAINRHDYHTCKFIWATDMEKVLEAGFTGANSRNGDILNIKFDNRDTTSANHATSIHIILHADAVLEVKDTGCIVYD